MNKIVFVNRYYRPDHSATAQLLTDLAEHIAAKGTSVSVVCSRLCYDDPRQRLPGREQLEKVAVYRVRTTAFGRQNLLGRALDYLSFYISCFIHLLILVKPGDVLVVKTDPPMISIVGAMVATLKRAELINWLQDLFPEVAKELGIGIMKTPMYAVMKWLRNRSLRVARSNIVLGELMAKRINKEIGLSAKSIVIPNWVVHSAIHPITHDLNPLRQEWNLNDKFVVGYSGNLGRAHEFKTILDSILVLRAEPLIHFLFTGGGAQLAPVKSFVRQHQLSNVSFKPYQPVETLSSSLSVADVHLVSLQPELEGLIVPSKFYGIVAVGRPVIFIGSADGELATLIHANGCGTTISPGDSASLVRYVLYLKNKPQAQAAASSNSQQLGSTVLTRRNSINAWESVLAFKERYQ